MAILVTGGAGYIGSVTVEYLRSKGESVVVLDDLFRGHRAAVDESVPFYEGKIGNRELVERITKEHDIESCIHFAALAYVGESVADPAVYYENNVEQAVAFLSVLKKAGVKRVVFSSTCATYGEPLYVPIDEAHQQQPTNPYGWSKLFVEKILDSYDHAYGMKFVALRYFNASGAIESRGEHHEPESHLIPNVLGAAQGKLSHVTVLGKDFPTPDGTAIRDYIHVVDLAQAHHSALEHLRRGGNSEKINLGNGQGYSVMEVIETARQVTGKEIKVEIAPPRPGDPSRLISNSEKAYKILNWKPQYPQLTEIIRTAWEWHSSHPSGYQD